MKNEKLNEGKNQPLLNLITALLIAILVISASVTFTLFDKGAYERMVARENLPQSAGMSEAEILANYRALIDYNSIFFTGPLLFPTLPMSDAGRTHFEEVKTIFSVFQIALLVSAALTALIFIAVMLRKRQFRFSYIASFIKLGGIAALVIPAAVVSIVAIVGWDRFFALFHQLFFNNEFWVFDYRTDPVILILPDAWFLNCLVRIVLGVVISSVILIVAGRKIAKTLEYSANM